MAILAPRSLSTDSLSLENHARFELDALHQQFDTEALNATALGSMVAGSLAGRLAKAFSLSAFRFLPSLVHAPINSLFSLSVEIAAFRGVQHAASPVSEAYWSWESFLREGFSFGAIKGSAYLLGGASPVLMQVSQSLGMMLGEELGSRCDLFASNSGSFAERFIQASAKTFAMGAGSAFSEWMLGGQISRLGRQLELQSHYSTLKESMGTRPLALQMASNDSPYLPNGLHKDFLRQWSSELSEQWARLKRTDPSLPGLHFSLERLDEIGLILVSRIAGALKEMAKGAPRPPTEIEHFFIGMIDRVGSTAYETIQESVYHRAYKDFSEGEKQPYREMALRVFELHSHIAVYARQEAIDRQFIMFDHIHYSFLNDQLHRTELALIAAARRHYGCANALGRLTLEAERAEREMARQAVVQAQGPLLEVTKANLPFPNPFRRLARLFHFRWPFE